MTQSQILSILKSKLVNINRLKEITDKGLPWHRYNFIQDEKRHLTEEEFEILKRWIKA